MHKFIFSAIIVGLIAAISIAEANAEPAYAESGLNLPANLQQQPKVSLIADCYDDCDISTLATDTGDYAIAIVKNNAVVASGLMPIDPGLTGSPEHMPPGGTGAIINRTESRAIDERGRMGTVIAKDTWTYVNYLLRSVSVKREFIVDDMYAGGG